MPFSLNTGRLVLEDMDEVDFANIQRIAKNPDVMRYVLIWLENDEQIAQFLQDAINEAQRKDRVNYRLAARTRTTGEYAGMSLLEIDPVKTSTAEVGCVLLPAFWRNSYASEILRALLAFGFGTLGLHRIYGKCDTLNAASAHVMEKGGMRYEGTHREDVWLRDHWRSTSYYGILADEFEDGQR